MIRYALREGVVLAWWTRALKPQTKLIDLHRYWEHGNSIHKSFASGIHCDFVARATIFVALTMVNEPLLQQASKVVEKEVHQPLIMKINIAPEIPFQYTGILQGQDTVPSFFTEEFAPIVADYYNLAHVPAINTGCQGNCTAWVPGAGFTIDCSRNETTFNASVLSNQQQSEHLNRTVNVPAVNVFESTIAWDKWTPKNLSINVQYAPDSGCEGSLVVRNCTLALATVKYKVLVNGIGGFISLFPDSSMSDDEMMNNYGEHWPLVEVVTGSRSTLGGFYLALSSRFSSWINLGFDTTLPWPLYHEYSTFGSLANQFVSGHISFLDIAHCPLGFRDPMDYLISNARELMFRTAIASANASQIQYVEARESRLMPVYESNFRYLVLSSVLTTVAILFIIPTIWGYWRLGRAVSMNPIEIAKAFNAPLLRNEDPNQEVGQLIKEVGHRDVRYGAVSPGDIMGEQEAGRGDGPRFRVQVPPRNLEMAEPGKVETPLDGETFEGAGMVWE